MREDILELLCKKNNLSYIIFDREFKVLDTNSSLVQKSYDLREFLWELTGMEEALFKSLEEEKFFEIPMVYRDAEYYDLEIETLHDEENFIAYIKKKSHSTHEYANALKEINKKTLVYDTSDEKKFNNYYKEINKHLITFHVDLDGMITMVNDACLYFFNIEKEKMLSKHFSNFFKTQKSQLDTATNIFIATNSMQEEIFFHADIIPLTNSFGKVVENIIVAQDITHLKKIKRELEYAQEHDALTGLPNRHIFLNSVDKAIETKESFHICFINIDRFQTINEEYGAHAADMLLKHITTLLLEFIEKDDLLVRLYSDNFAIIFHIKKEKEYIQSLVEQIALLADENPLHYNHEDSISFSYTTLLLSYPEDVKNAKEFLLVYEKEMQRKKIEVRNLKT